jgi:glycosyltransferase involved in cell wall biosynthesis
LRVLYVGSLGQRKGLSYALDAVQALGTKVTLTLIGRNTSPECVPLVAALERHRWVETLPHSQILEQMHQHDVLVLPSLFEGFALVIGEALSQALPVIATANSGATEVVREGVEGFIVPIRDSQTIAERLQQLAEDRYLLVTMRQACLRRAEEMNWASYEQGLLAVVGQALSKGHQPA